MTTTRRQHRARALLDFLFPGAYPTPPQPRPILAPGLHWMAIDPGAYTGVGIVTTPCVIMPVDHQSHVRIIPDTNRRATVQELAAWRRAHGTQSADAVLGQS